MVLENVLEKYRLYHSKTFPYSISTVALTLLVKEDPVTPRHFRRCVLVYKLHTCYNANRSRLRVQALALVLLNQMVRFDKLCAHRSANSISDFSLA